MEVPASLLDHLVLDGLDGAAVNLVSPIVCVTDKGNYIIQGERIIDAETLNQMNIPDHETCVQVTKSAIRGPRRRVSTLQLPGNDFWMFDRQIVAFTHLSGGGHVLDYEMTTDPTVVDACSAAFENAWKIAVPHHEYTPS